MFYDSVYARFCWSDLSPDIDSNYTINQVFNLHDPLDNIPLSKAENENVFLPATENWHLIYYKNNKTLILQLDN